MLPEGQWHEFARDGVLRLGAVLADDEVDALKRRADDLALGRVVNPAVRMQLDTGGAYEDLRDTVSRFEEGTHLYRKIQGLEHDDLFSRLVRHQLVREVCARLYGRHASVSLFRAMVMNKPAGRGTVLPWHQDGGDVWALDRDPLVTVWVALDPATRTNGCMEIVRGTHRLGLLTDRGSTLDDAAARRHCPPGDVQPLEVEPGHAVLLHNWLIHRSGTNPSAVPRRAFTACYMDGRTRSVLTGERFPMVFGALPNRPDHFVLHLRQECEVLRENARNAEVYALSLERDNRALRASRDEIERYARSLEAERHAREQRAA